MLVINSIEKTRLSADSYSYSGTGVAWKARLVLFLGFALMAGGLAGSVVSWGFSSLESGEERRAGLRNGRAHACSEAECPSWPAKIPLRENMERMLRTIMLTIPQAVLVLKYIVPEYGFPTLYLGVANVIANGLIMLRYPSSLPRPPRLQVLNINSSVVLWVSQNMEDDYTYHLAL